MFSDQQTKTKHPIFCTLIDTRLILFDSTYNYQAKNQNNGLNQMFCISENVCNFTVPSLRRRAKLMEVSDESLKPLNDLKAFV